MSKNHKGRGSVGKSLRNGRRLRNDKEFREKRRKLEREWWNKNIEKNREKKRKYALELSKFKNKRCLDCNKLLNWKTKGNYCKKCMNLEKNKNEQKTD